MLAALYNIPRDEQGLAVFSFHNADEHTRIAEALQRGGVSVSTYILDPISEKSMAAWLDVHQSAHTEMDSALGIVGNDLSEVDFKNPSQVASWIWLHAQEHLQAATKLGLS